jgi:anti-sigma factor RsiW
MKNFRDIELLSSYLDGRLSPSESVRLEARLASDPGLASAFEDLRAARSILRKLPSRKAPRNFTLTRQMVGLRPPLPRSYSFFRFSTAFATVLLTLTFAANALSRIPLMGDYAGGFGMGGGGGGAAESAAAPVEAPAAAEAVGGGPAATEAPAVAMELAVPATTATPAGTLAPAAPAVEMVPMPTLSADAAATEAPTAKQMATPPEAMDQPPVQNQPEAESVPVEPLQRQPLIPVAWQGILFILILLSGLTAFLLRRSAMQKWK